MHHRQFTLIELLIAIAILAILAGLLLPALNKARETAKQSFCRNNLRQLNMGFVNYGDDYGGYYPIANDGVGKVWDGQIREYVGLGGDISILHDKYEKSVYHCPSEYPHTKLSPVWQRIDYGMNSELNEWPNETKPVKITNKRKISQIFLLMDAHARAVTRNVYKSSPAFFPDLGYGDISHRHSMSLNVLFCDDHIDSFKRPWPELGSAIFEPWRPRP